MPELRRKGEAFVLDIVGTNNARMYQDTLDALNVEAGNTFG